MHYVWVTLKVLIIAKLLILAAVALVLLKPFLRNRRRLIPHA
ncbi:MAG TPA: hypothetical protein VN723_11665 [Rhizomicrobium sp.]|jgi:hypothetical protein|nr:hypothetical protein [Rhizomicrobium sp.]